MKSSIPYARVDLHDVPEDRLLADLDHRLRPDGRLLAEPGAEAAGEEDDLHAARHRELDDARS